MIKILESFAVVPLLNYHKSIENHSVAFFLFCSNTCHAHFRSFSCFVYVNHYIEFCYRRRREESLMSRLADTHERTSYYSYRAML
jgi:hypothetical protein